MKSKIVENSNQWIKSIYYENRNRDVFQEHLRGLSYQDLSFKYQISVARVGQIIKRGKGIKPKPKPKKN